MSLLVIEDERKIREFLRRGLEEEGYRVEVAADGENGLDLATGNGYELIILDLLLPRRDGLEVCRTLRAQGVTTPVLMLTARDTVRGKGITLDTSGPAALVVWGDSDRLRQLLTNLVDNAITYTPPGGRVRLTWDRDGSMVRMAVIDTGTGIAPEDLPLVFDRFYRADRARARTSGGSGLGLPIAQVIVRAHGGRIAVESQPRRGTTVTVWLPLRGDNEPSHRG